jgi:hypothetical protein
VRTPPHVVPSRCRNQRRWYCSRILFNFLNSGNSTKHRHIASKRRLQGNNPQSPSATGILIKRPAFQVRGEGLAQLYELMARLGDRVGSKLVCSSFEGLGASRSFRRSCVSGCSVYDVLFQIPMTDHIVARLGDGNSKIVLQVAAVHGVLPSSSAA